MIVQDIYIWTLVRVKSLCEGEGKKGVTKEKGVCVCVLGGGGNLEF